MENMNVYLGVMLIGLAVILFTIWEDYSKVKKNYNVVWNGRRWVVRDSKGRFVRITRNPWNLLILGVGL